MAENMVLITTRSFASSDNQAVELLEANDCEAIFITEKNGPVNKQLKELLPAADAVIAGLDVYDETLLKTAARLKVISRYGVGYDKVDISAAEKRGISVTITPGANEDSVADLAFALMLAAARNIAFSDRMLRQGVQSRTTGIEMWRKTLGVVGTGRIGKGVIKRAKGFEMQVLCYDIYRDEEFAEQYGANYVSFDRLIEESDFITIHTPLIDATRNLFSTPQFKVMKPQAVLVNTARGGIIDEDALYEALLGGVIGAAAADVMNREPPFGSSLLTLDNFTATPHNGANTYNSVSRMSLMAVQNVLDVLKTGKCRYDVRKI